MSELRISDLKSLKIDKEAQLKPGPWRGMGKWVVFALIAAAIFAGAYFAVYTLTHRPATVKTVVVTRAKPFAVAPLLTAGGYVISKNQLIVGPKIQGRIEKLLVNEGDLVKVGTLIATLEDKEEKAQLDLDRAAYEQAVLDFKRSKQLIEEKVISQAEYDKAESEMKVKKAQMDLSQARWENTQILTPIEGIIAEKVADVGEVTSPVTEIQSSGKTGIFKIYNPNHMQVEMDISEADIHKVKRDQKAMVTLDAVRGKAYAAHVEEILPIADRQKSTVSVKVRIEEPDEQLRPEMSAKISFISPETKMETQTETKLLIPAAAVAARDGGKTVFVVEGDRASARPVETGETFGGNVEIKAGLNEGEEVVVSSSKELADGMKVTRK